MIEQKMHCPPRCVSLFCSTKLSTCLFVMDLTCSSICVLLSSGKFPNCFRRCSFIFWVSSCVSGMVK